MIVLTRSEDHVEAINSTLRNAGHPVHCTWLPDARDLADALIQINPEMLIVFITELDVDLASIMKVKTESAPEMPILIVRDQVDEATIAEAMRLGAQDVVTLANRSRLQSVATRELRAFRLERALTTTLSSARDYREQLTHFLQGSADAITHVQEGIIVDANRAWLELFGYSSDDALTGGLLMDLFEPETHPALKGALVACLQGKWTDHALKVQALLSDGSALPLEVTLARALFESEPAIRICVPARQKTDRDVEKQLAEAVKNDATTGFLQQRYLIAALRERCNQPMRGGVREVAYVKADRFNDILETLGALNVEEFLSQFADALRSQLTPGDICGKFGGNGFLIMLERGTGRDVETWANNLVTRIAAQSFTVAATTVSTTVTVGLAALHGGGELDAAAAAALAAHRRARKDGGNRISSPLKAQTEAPIEAHDKVWVKHIKSALMENRFRLVHQPIASLLGEDKGMFDVLVRMLDEQGSEVLPAEFIAAAERNDLMKNIDRWVIGASVSFCANRKSECIFLRISKDSVLDKSLIGWLENQLKAIRIEPKRLCFQVSEELALAHLRPTMALAQSLRKLGLRFAIEHFGVAGESQRLLEGIDLNFIKIDGSLMQGLSTSVLQQQKVKALVEAAKAKRVETVAERVQDANTMAVLWQLGIEFIQGYFVNTPEEVTMSGDR